MIAFSCHKCGKQFSLKPEFAGRSTTCSSCKQAIVVPASEQTITHAPKASETVAPVAAAKISFSCMKCAMKFSVQAVFAGRSTKCPTCKEPLVVPSTAETIAYEAPAGQIQGAPSSLARAGVDGGVTLQGDVDAAARQTSLQNLMDGKSNDGARYVIESELARGGMGAVLRAVDCDIRREVAVKYLLDQSKLHNKIRFIEEAQITGQLEHPNIVPIHELGVDAKKRIFFSMKMVKGRSLAQILKDQRKPLASNPALARGDAKEYSMGRLLNIFVNICNGLAYAHSRGVVHRDLKPANIMVGDFGEVYVMDWGLAKVLRKGAAAAPDTGSATAIPVAALAAQAGPFDFSAPHSSLPLATPIASNAPASMSGKVVTSRELDADLTQEGSVLGTPVYMPPEQATGQIHDIDERSDVYSMGAILYEILTLQPPIDKEGGFPAILKRVNDGQIEQPEKKNPERTRAGNVPPELAAVAMKALAKRREDRYQGIEFLRHDVERFMEGRSVSAKHDTFREACVKLIKRNKGVSIASAAASVVLGIVAIWSLVAIFGANARTQRAYDDYRAEQVSKREQAKKSVPAFVRAASLLMSENKFSDAMAQVDAALLFDEDEVEARLMRGQMLVGKQEYKTAQAEFQTCLKLKPDHAGAKNLADLCAKASPEHSGQLLALANELGRQRAFTLANQVTLQAEKLVVSRQELASHYRKRIEAAWPGRGSRLEFDEAGKFTLNFGSFKDVTNLTPLQGMKLSTLIINDCPVTDLTPLLGMMLTDPIITSCPVGDLAPLKGMPLTRLNLSNSAKIITLAPLQCMPLTYLALGPCKVADLTPIKGMPLTSLSLYGCREITDLKPLKGMPLTRLDLNLCSKIRDLSPLQGMPLTTLNLYRCHMINDLTPLRGMPLNSLDLFECGPGTATIDITVLKGMPLKSLVVWHSQVVDLGPLKELPLKSLGLQICYKVTDWTPLKEMKLTRLELDNCTNLADLTPLAGMALKELSLIGCVVNDLTPLKGMPLDKLNMKVCKNLQDLTPLAGMSLTHITLPPQVTKGIDGIRTMKTLRSIDNESPEIFWKKWDATKAK